MVDTVKDYIDTNGNGIPNRFENRLPLSEILNAPPGLLPCDTSLMLIEVELQKRSPKKGELFLSADDKVCKAGFDYGKHSNFKGWIIRRIIAGSPEVEKQ